MREKPYAPEIGQLEDDKELPTSNNAIPMTLIVHVKVIGVINGIINPKIPVKL